MTTKKPISNRTLASVLTEHKRWVESEGASGNRAMLGGYDLSHTPLGGAVLRDANLSGVCLYRANLCSTDLRGAYMQDADLRGSCLIEADMRGANLYGVDLTGADVTDAKFDDCWLVVNGKLVRKDNVPSVNDNTKRVADYDFAFKFDIASRLIDG